MPDLADLRGDIDDPAAPLREHAGEHAARDDEGAAQVRGDHLVPHGDRHRLDGSERDEASIIDEDVDATERGEDPIDHRADRSFPRHIGLHDHRAPAHRLDLTRDVVRIAHRAAVGDRNIRALDPRPRARRRGRSPDRSRGCPP